MANKAVPDPSLRPTASPVDRYVRPQMVEPEPSGLSAIAQSLQTVNPKLQRILGDAAQEKAKTDEAAGMMAESTVDPTISLENNRQGWKRLIEEVRKSDPDRANELAGSSPHFRRGLAKARASRLGRGLSLALKSAWESNAGGIKSMDDPAQVQKWISERAREYASENGLNQIDPVIAQEAYMPHVLQAQDRLLGDHMEFRAKSRVTEYKNELSASLGWALAGADGEGASDPDTFLRRLTGAESGGNAGAFRTNKDGRSYAGLVQMGKARLKDWSNATGNAPMTPAQYANLSESEQLKIARWHIKDIDEQIKATGALSRGWSLDGLRAVAHLGGVGGMREFVETKGANGGVADELGTSLANYYTRFSSTSGYVQQTMDEAIANGLPAGEVNEQAVKDVIATATELQDTSILNVLDQLSTGSGPVGNIGWVKEARAKAKDDIEDEIFETENRERKREDWAEADAKYGLKLQGYRALMENPTADHSELIAQTRDAGFPDLARDLQNFQTTLQSREREVITNHVLIEDIRRSILTGDVPDSDILDRVTKAVRNGEMSGTTANSLYDDLGDPEGNIERIREPYVKGELDSAESILGERFNPSGAFIPDPKAGEVAATKRRKFRNEASDQIIAFLEDNPDASPAKVRIHAREVVDKLLEKPRYSSGMQVPTTRTQLDGEGDSGSGSEASRQGSTGLAAVAMDGPFKGLTEQQQKAAWQRFTERSGRNITFEDFVDQAWQSFNATQPEEEQPSTGGAHPYMR